MKDFWSPKVVTAIFLAFILLGGLYFYSVRSDPESKGVLIETVYGDANNWISVQDVKLENGAIIVSQTKIGNGGYIVAYRPGLRENIPLGDRLNASELLVNTAGVSKYLSAGKRHAVRIPLSLEAEPSFFVLTLYQDDGDRGFNENQDTLVKTARGKPIIAPLNFSTGPSFEAE